MSDALVRWILDRAWNCGSLRGYRYYLLWVGEFFYVVRGKESINEGFTIQSDKLPVDLVHFCIALFGCDVVIVGGSFN